MRLSAAPLRVAESERGDEANLCALHVCDGYAADQVCVALPLRCLFFPPIPVIPGLCSLVVLIVVPSRTGVVPFQRPPSYFLSDNRPVPPFFYLACYSMMLTLHIVVLSAIQDILLQLHLRECGLL